MTHATRSTAKENTETATMADTGGARMVSHVDTRPVAARQREIAQMVAQSPRLAQLRAQQATIQSAPARAIPNNTGLPDALKSGIEQLSGMSMNHVKVHYNSAQPAQLQAHAYAQGSQIHLGPGQEHHLPHEAWHVVQQAQGRVPVTRQAKGMVAINDDAGLEKEADVMGGRASQLASNGTSPIAAQAGAPVGSGGVAQLVDKLKIGITGSTAALPFTWEQLPPDTFVWILTNQKVAVDGLDKDKVKPGQDKTSIKDIIDANRNEVSVPILHSANTRQGMEIGGFHQSGIFRIPRRDHEEVDYSFLRYAAFQSYRDWSNANRSRTWPDLDAGGTQVETIDSDFSGITSKSTGSPKENKGKGWMAQAGVYKWNLSPIKSDPKVKAAFMGRPDGELNTQLDKFAGVYTSAEIAKRTEAASASILKIYFPEPATRLSSYALGLLNDPLLGAMKVTAGNQLGYGRESIGMIAALVHRDGGGPRATAKLGFDPTFVVETDLGKRKDAYVALFLSWQARVSTGADADSEAVVEALPGLAEFDQSYLNPGVPNQVEKWHNKTLGEMNKNVDAFAGAFFHPS